MTVEELRAAAKRERINAEILEIHYRAHKQAAEDYEQQIATLELASSFEGLRERTRCWPLLVDGTEFLHGGGRD